MDTSALHQISCGLYVIGVKNGRIFGGSIVDALIQATSCKPPHIIFCSMNRNYTTELINKTGEFTVSILTQDVNPFIIANFGFQSGRDVDKWANTEHTVKDGLPVLKDAAGFIRCRLEDVKMMATHNVFTAVVENSWIGGGEPLLYGDYHKVLKGSVADAYKVYRETGKAPLFGTPSASLPTSQQKTQKWVCILCGYVYDEATPFEDLPDDWVCPLCGAGKQYFEKQ